MNDNEETLGFLFDKLENRPHYIKPKPVKLPYSTTVIKEIVAEIDRSDRLTRETVKSQMDRVIAQIPPQKEWAIAFFNTMKTEIPDPVTKEFKAELVREIESYVTIEKNSWGKW